MKTIYLIILCIFLFWLSSYIPVKKEEPLGQVLTPTEPTPEPTPEPIKIQRRRSQ